MPLTAKQISALVDAGATDDEIHAMHEKSNAAPAKSESPVWGADKMYHPGASDSPTSAYAKELGRTAGQTLKGVVESPLDVLHGILGLGGAIAHPIDTARSIGSAVSNAAQHPLDTITNAVKSVSDPETGGRTIGNLLLGEAIPRGIGAAGRAVAGAPVVQKTLGGVAGAAIGASLGHPYIGFGLGSKYGGDVVGAAAEQAGKVKSLGQLLEAGGGPTEGGGDIVRGAEMYKPGTIPMHDAINADVPQPAPRARVSTAQPSMMPAHDTGYGGDVVSNPEVNPKTASAGSLPAAGARDTMLKDIFGGEYLRDVFNGKGGVQRRPLPAGMRGDYPPDVGGEYSNYPQEFQHVGGGTTPPAAGNQNDYNWQKITAPEVPSRTEVPEETAAQLETATEPRVSVQGLDKATTPEVAPEDAGESESPASKLAKILGTPSDADVAAAIAKRQYKG